MPGQAISYKVGERVWLEGRERARNRLGEAFDLKRFHQVMLDMGAMGLDQLRDELDAFGSPDDEPAASQTLIGSGDTIEEPVDEVFSGRLALGDVAA